MRILISLIFCLIPALSLAQEQTPPESEVAFVTKLFDRLQAQSFERNQEICGYLGYGEDGRLTRTRIVYGGEAECYLPNWPENIEVIASFHTHSTYSPDYDSELPSSTDMESDEESGIDGWVATPGGRLWYIDTTDMVTYQVCGVGCLPQDPNFRPAPDGAVRESYSYRAILKSESR